MDREKRIIYISENIDLVENTNEIINYIKHHEINYSQNSNGLFINLSLLEDKHIISISDMIKISLKLNLNEAKTILSKTSNKKCEEQVYKPLKLTDLQKDIINSVF
tara:strand:- start:198 stop:515 length:318 start_codon:yes stop_codon:yes gene_type:complete